MTVSLRKMTDADLPAVLAIEHRSFTQPWSETLFRIEVYNPAASCMVAEDGGRIVGYFCAATVLDEMNLHTIAVAPESRGRGVARLLMDRLFENARRLGASLIHLEVRASNAAARRLYGGFGFREVGLRKGYYQSPLEDAVLYTAEVR